MSGTAGPAAGSVVTVTTLKDSLPHVRRFVDGNRRGGVDHLVVVLDDPAAPGQDEVLGWLRDEPGVTVVAADEQWWAGHRPEALNVRQRTNANLVKHVLSSDGGAGGWAAWVLHVDGDEVVQLDRERLAAVPDSADAVRLETWEAVSRADATDDPTWFKRLLGDDDLTLLGVLGVLEKPSNAVYFHGNVEGKSGVRPDADAWLTLHRVVDAERQEIEHARDEAFRVLHYESYSAADFVRKWTALATSGPRPAFRPARDHASVALHTLIGKGLDPATLEPYLHRIFERTTADDVDTLADLGLLHHADPATGIHTPAAPGDGVAALRDRLAEVHGWRKRQFRPPERPGTTGRLGRAFRKTRNTPPAPED